MSTAVLSARLFAKHAGFWRFDRERDGASSVGATASDEALSFASSVTPNTHVAFLLNSTGFFRTRSRAAPRLLDFPPP